jgi:hypothetical protein
MEQPVKQQQQQQQLVEQYIAQMTPLERQAYEIAKSHLNTSFSIVKSNGFNQWLKKLK